MKLRRPISIVAALAGSVLAAAPAGSLIAPAPAGAQGASTARVATTAAETRVLDRYLEATGGRAAWERDATTHAWLSLTAFGFTGASEQWSARPDSAASVTGLGPLTLRQGTLGARAWRVDQNGNLRWLDGRELEEARAAAYFDQELWLAPGLGGGQAKLLPAESEGGKALDVLEITPPAGKPRRLYFEHASGLLTKLIQPADAETLVVRLSGYELVAGRLRPRDTLQRLTGAPANDVRAHLDSLVAGVPLDSTIFLPPRALTRDFRFLNGDSVAVIPMSYSVRHVWLKVSVNGQPPTDFLLDTGASVSVIDSAYAAGLGLASQGQLSAAGAGASGTMGFARVSSLRVAGAGDAGVEVTGQNVVVGALNALMAPAFWRDAAGVLGYDFISRFVLTVDYAKQQLVLSDPDRFAYRGPGAALPMTLAAGVPVVRGRLDDRYEGDFRLDVGSGSSVDLHTPFVKENGLEEKAAKKVPDPAGGFGGMFERVATRMQSFALGPYVIDAPIVELSQATVGALASRDYAGNVGNRVLDRFTCTFDYGRKQLYLEPGAHLTDRQAFTRFGAQLFKSGDRVAAGFVIPGSAAARAGLAEGDEVIAIAGRPAASYTPDELTAFFEKQPDGTRVALEFQHGGKTRKATAKLLTLL